jgi:hypothetical protein
MRSIHGRLDKLEDRLGIARNAPRYLLMLMRAGTELSPAEEEAYIKSLDDAGKLPTSGFGLVVFPDISNRTGVKPGAAAPQITIELERAGE